MLGGRRPGAGRPAGSRNKRTQDIIDGAAEGGVMPLEYLLGLMRDEAQPLPVRLEAAKSAAPYVHPRLAAIEHSGELQHRDVSDEPMSEDEWTAVYCQGSDTPTSGH